jgi:hypothetical protein
MAAGDGELFSSSLNNGVRGLRCTTGDGENTNGGSRLWQTFPDGWLSMRGSTPTRQRAKMVVGVQSF